MMTAMMNLSTDPSLRSISGAQNRHDQMRRMAPQNEGTTETMILAKGGAPSSHGEGKRRDIMIERMVRRQVTNASLDQDQGGPYFTLLFYCSLTLFFSSFVRRLNCAGVIFQTCLIYGVYPIEIL